ncbi:DUF3037 domain-containing protein [Deinococcus sp. Arct2-2]|uniref:DUF3037 domain-containing protein n=1 Tax=Deinococcus sp. Arct2-2 TaxID=2568653 RepID=UPI0010A2DB1E|nr:DUF3037 domain-containing protein [Deinococcus sp. Arct2-2]THF70458.1 DUF3037 domain-containing protein [Deinococcus sp. Arct2-2]
MTHVPPTTSLIQPREVIAVEGLPALWGERTYMRIIQYVPNELRDERVNIGIALQNPSHGYAGVRVRPYMDSLLQALWPAIDAEIVRLMVKEIEELLKPLNRATRKGPQRLWTEAYDERAIPTFLDRFNQTYGSIRIAESKPVRVSEGESFREKLNQLFELYIRVDDGKQKRNSITKEIIQFQVGKELDRRGAVYTQHAVIRGEFFENKFDVARHRIDAVDSLAHIISFDLKNVDPATTQSLRLLQSLGDLKGADPRLLEKYEFGVFLQAPIHHRQHRTAYEDALKALRTKFKVFQNTDDEPALVQATVKFVDSIASDEGFSAA